MIYGLYLSATGVLANSYRQDVIANNLANSETVGFKRDLALFRERQTATGERGLSARQHSDPRLENTGGGFLCAPTLVDASQGELEQTGNAWDLCLQGEGFFAVNEGGKTRLTRNGQFMVNRAGNVVTAAGAHEVLDPTGKPIKLGSNAPVTINDAGLVTQNEEVVARVGVFDVADRSKLRKLGATLMDPLDQKLTAPAAGKGPMVHSGFVERSNVDPSIELAQLMDAQRLLEANANMIRFQDQMLARLVNDVGKIG